MTIKHAPNCARTIIDGAGPCTCGAIIAYAMECGVIANPDEQPGTSGLKEESK